MRVIGYNSQRNNFNFAGKFPAWSQCFSTCAWMFISYFDKSINALSDEGLSRYVDDVEAEVGNVGIAEKIKQKYNWITGKTSLWWLVQQAGIQAMLPSHNIQFDEHFPIVNLTTKIQQSPIIIGTNKMGGLPGGHIILLVDYDIHSFQWLVNDPFGNAITNYQVKNGEMKNYPIEFLDQFIDVGNRQCRIIYAS